MLGNIPTKILKEPSDGLTCTLRLREKLRFCIKKVWTEVQYSNGVVWKYLHENGFQKAKIFYFGWYNWTLECFAVKPQIIQIDQLHDRAIVRTPFPPY